MSSVLPKLALRRETVRNLGVKSSVRAGSLVGAFSNGSVAGQSSPDPVPTGGGPIGPHSIDPGGGGGGPPPAPPGWFHF